MAKATTISKRSAKRPALTQVTTKVTLAALGGTRPSTCGQLFELSADKVIASEGCKRLPRHHGEHKADRKPRGLMTPAERARLDASRSKAASKAAPKSASKIVTIAGTKFRVTVTGGKVVTTPVVEAPAPAPVAK